MQSLTLLCTKYDGRLVGYGLDWISRYGLVGWMRIQLINQNRGTKTGKCHGHKNLLVRPWMLILCHSISYPVVVLSYIRILKLNWLIIFYFVLKWYDQHTVNICSTSNIITKIMYDFQNCRSLFLIYMLIFDIIINNTIYNLL